MNLGAAPAGAATKLPLTFACGLYDRMLRLYTGEVAPRGIDLKFLANDEPRDIFDRMGGKLEFDASEMSSSESSAASAPANARSSPSRHSPPASSAMDSFSSIARRASARRRTWKAGASAFRSTP
jgi:hypothetical protein